MEFHKWLFQESSLNDLYTQTVRAFPKTTKRQHAVDPIKITKLEWIPYLGVNTLYIKGLAQSDSGKEYEPIIVFKGVNYKPSDGAIKIEISANDGKNYLFEKLSYANNDVLLRCSCADFSWRWNFTDHVDHSLFGKKRKKYESKGGPAANPLELPGACKHLLKLVKVLQKSGIF